MRHRHMRSAQFAFIQGKLLCHAVKINGETYHFRRCILDKFRLAAELPLRDFISRLS